MVFSSVPGAGLFRTSFLDQELVTFAECAAHYQGFGPGALMEEMRLLLTAPMLAVPFGLASSRYYALMDALIRCAGTSRDLSAAQRSKLVRVCIDIGTFLRGRTAERRAASFETALSTALESVTASRVHPEVAVTISAALRLTTDAPNADAAADSLQTLDFAEPPPALFALSA